MVSTPSASVTSTSFSSPPVNSAVKSIASLLSAMSILGASMSEPNPESGERREKSSNVFWTSRKSEGRYDLAMATSFDLRPTLETGTIRVSPPHCLRVLFEKMSQCHKELRRVPNVPSIERPHARRLRPPRPHQGRTSQTCSIQINCAALIQINDAAKVAAEVEIRSGRVRNARVEDVGPQSRGGDWSRS